MPRFLSDTTLKASSWQAWERTLARLLPLKGWKYAHVVGASGDRGADVIASLQTPNGATQKWVFQSKAWKNPVGSEVLEEIVTAIKALIDAFRSHFFVLILNDIHSPYPKIR